MAGTLAKTLAQKMGVKAGDRIATIAAPKDYARLLGRLPDEALIVHRAPNDGAEIVHLFVSTMAELETQLPRARQAVSPNGAVWVSCYKKISKVPTDVTENTIRALALSATDLVDVKVVAVTDQWSGLKFVVRKTVR
jgi:hypothetical protein